MSVDLQEKINAIQALNLAYSKVSLSYYLNCVIVPASPDPKPFRLCADPWQRETLAPLIPAFEHVAGIVKEYAGPLQFMKILARGHNKSSEQAWLTCWLLLASHRTIHGYIMAADRDQGALILQAARDFLALNPWIPVTIQKTKLLGPAGEVEVLPFDAKSGMGLRGNYFILDEIVHWKRQDEWTAVLSGEGKVTPCLWAVMSNAGLIDSWQHQVFLAAKADPSWVVFHKEGTLASWLNKEKLAKSRKMLPPSEADRLIDNKWIDPSEEHDYLRRAEVDACAVLGVQMGLQQRLRQWQGVTNYVAAVDYGVKRDRTALVILHVDGSKRTVIDRLDVWQGSDGKPVQVAQVEEWIERTNRDFRPRVYVIDPWQMEGTIQWCARKGIKAESFKFRSGQGNFELAQHLRAIVADRRLVWYPGAGALPGDTLEDELAGLRVKRMSYGYRFDHEVQKHDDRCLIAGTMIETDTGPRPIETVRRGDRVLTRDGYKTVISAGSTGTKPVYCVSIDGGPTLVGTGNHPVWTERGWVELSALTLTDRVTLCRMSKPSSTPDESTAGTRTLSIATTGYTSSVTISGKPRSGICTETSGPTLTDRFPPGTTFITRMITLLTTTWRTWAVCLRRAMPTNTMRLIAPDAVSGTRPKRVNRTLLRLRRLFTGGERPPSLRPLFEPMQKPAGPSALPGLSYAPSAGPNTLPGVQGLSCSAPTTARVRSVEPIGVAEVFNLTVDETPEYFANGVLVHNCFAIAAAALKATEFPFVDNTIRLPTPR